MKTIKKGLTLGLGMILMSSGLVMSQSIDDAKAAILGEQYAKAETMLKNLKSTKSKDGEAYFYLGQVYIHNEYLDSANTVFAEGIKADPKSPLNYIGQGQVKLQKGDSTGAKADFDLAIKTAKKKDYNPQLFIGKAYLTQKKPNFAAAEPYFQKALEMAPKASDNYKPEAAEILIGMGDFYRAQRDNSKATQYYYPALDLSPNAFLQASTQLGAMYKEARSFDSGKGQLEGVIAKDANYAPAYRELAELYMQWGSFNAGSDSTSEKSRQAIDYFKKYLDLTDKSFDSQKRFATILYYGKDYKELQTVSQSLIASNPNDFIANRMAGYAAAENGDGASSLTYMTKVFEIAKATNVEPISSDYLALGKAQMASGQDDQALENIKKAVAADSTFAPDLASVGKKYFDAKQYGKAADVYQAAVAASKSHANVATWNVYNALGRYYQVLTDSTLAKSPQGKELLTQGVAALDDVIKSAPDYADAYFYKGNLQVQIDDKTKPVGLYVPAYEKYIELNTKAGGTPNNVNLFQIYQTLAFNYLSKDKAKATEYLKKSLEITPDDEWAKFNLEELNAPAKKAVAAVKGAVKGKK